MSKRYLITGGAGFVGSHLAERLLAAGQRVVVLDDLSTGDPANLAAVAGHAAIDVCVGSVLESGIVDAVAAGVDGIFHLAAAVGVRRVVEHPTECMRVNIDGTRRVLAAAVRRRLPLLFASSSEVYGKSARLPFREQDDVVLGPTDCPRWTYASAKALGERQVLAHARENHMPFRVVRLFNTVGPRQRGRYGMVLPNFARQALAGEPLTVHGDGSQTRCFADVRDVVDSLARLMTAPAAIGQVINVGSNREISIADLAALVRARARSDSEIVRLSYERVFGPDFEDVPRRVPDLRRLRAIVVGGGGIALEQTVDDLLSARAFSELSGAAGLGAVEA